MLPATHETNEREDHDQGTRRGFSQRQPIHHLSLSQPAKVPNRLLAHISQKQDLVTHPALAR